MIQSETMLDVADNSGAKKLLCIKVLGGSKIRYAAVGSKIVCAVKEVNPKGSIKKGEVVLAVVVRTTYKLKRDDGTVIRFDTNSAVLINKDGNPKGTRVFGPIPRELRNLGYKKIISLSGHVI